MTLRNTDSIWFPYQRMTSAETALELPSGTPKDDMNPTSAVPLKRAVKLQEEVDPETTNLWDLPLSVPLCQTQNRDQQHLT